MVSSSFPALKAAKVLTILRNLGYETIRTKGSHRTMTCAGRPRITFSYTGGDTVPPGVLRDILMKQIGLTLDEAREAVRR